MSGVSINSAVLESAKKHIRIIKMTNIKFLIRTVAKQEGLYKNLLRPNIISVSASRFFISTSRNDDPDAPIDMPNPFEKERRVCILCKLNIYPDYKNVKLLSQFQSPYTGRIYGRHITGLCKQKQSEVEVAIIKAQNCALMPTHHKHIDFMADPKLFNPEKPLRPHKY